MELRFIIDVKHKKKAISHCGVLWRRFKTHLTKEFVTPYLDDPSLLENPPYLWYVYLDMKTPDWLKFVMIRCSEEFQLSKLQAERRDVNEYDHRIGKDGYIGLADKMKAAEVSIDPKDRHVMWLLARQDKKGEYSNDATKEIAEKISKSIKEKGIVATSKFIPINWMMFQKYKLALGSKDNVVVEGSVYPMTKAATSMHCLTFPDAYVRVSIEKALSGGALLPLPNGSGEHSCVKDAVGSFVAKGIRDT